MVRVEEHARVDSMVAFDHKHLAISFNHTLQMHTPKSLVEKYFRCSYVGNINFSDDHCKKCEPHDQVPQGALSVYGWR